MPPYRGIRALVARGSCFLSPLVLGGLGWSRPVQAPRHHVEASHGPLGTSTWCGSHRGAPAWVPLLSGAPSLLLLLLLLLLPLLLLLLVQRGPGFSWTPCHVSTWPHGWRR